MKADTLVKDWDRNFSIATSNVCALPCDLMVMGCDRPSLDFDACLLDLCFRSWGYRPIVGAAQCTICTCASCLCCLGFFAGSARDAYANLSLRKPEHAINLPTPGEANTQLERVRLLGPPVQKML